MGEAKRVYQARDGVRRTLISDGSTPDVFHVKTEQDVEPVLDSIARDRELFTQRGPNKVVGRLPMIVVEDLMRRGIYDDPDAFDRWWGSIEANPWRIWKGSIR